MLNMLIFLKYNLVYWLVIYLGEFKFDMNLFINCFFKSLNVFVFWKLFFLLCNLFNNNFFNLFGFLVVFVMIEKLYVGFSINW